MKAGKAHGFQPWEGVKQENYKDWENSFDALHDSFKILGHEF